MSFPIGIYLALSIISLGMSIVSFAHHSYEWIRFYIVITIILTTSVTILTNIECVK